uniref:Platelet-derived growth factor (PDGF) family profile domain-containing protein n=1 Tax=Eptatretus burgeri TaxID=7764 RepID=A0A8C4NAE4_EPTBU
MHPAFLILVLLTPAVETMSVSAWDSPSSANEVMEFKDAIRLTQCQPRDAIVDVATEYPHESSFTFRPSGVPVRRCGGCCTDHQRECIAVESRNVSVELFKTSFKKAQFVVMSFALHTNCKCRCKPCLKPNFVLDTKTCACTCNITCRHKQVPNRHCRCEKVRR